MCKVITELDKANFLTAGDSSVAYSVLFTKHVENKCAVWIPESSVIPSYNSFRMSHGMCLPRPSPCFFL